MQENQITGHDLVDLSEADLADLGVTKIGHKKIILASTAELFCGSPAVAKGACVRLAYVSVYLCADAAVVVVVGVPGGVNASSPRKIPITPGR